MHSHFTAVFDACVLYPATLRNVLMQLATTGLFRARWTDAIHDEWMRNLLESKPDIGRDNVDRLREQMDKAVQDCLVTGYESLIEGLVLPDEDDRHVLAAAIRCHAAVIVTTNLKDFPDDTLLPLGVRAQHPDEFILHLIDLDSAAVCLAVKAIRQRLKNPPYDATGLLDLLQSQGLPGTVSKLREFEKLI
ncbi:MAG: PIN domain-containing protein [Phycisphaerales bacterium]|nr:PIN domain-containing protein [Phycisphaerales bacterium]